MKTFKRTIFLLTITFIMASFSQCSTAQKLQPKAPTKFGQVYCQNWVAGIQGGGSGTNIFIPMENTSMSLDSVYFRGHAVKLEIKPQEKGQLFVGRITSDFNSPNEPTMNGNDAMAEKDLKNEASKLPFELKEDECVISYKDGTVTKYYKISNVVEKASTPMMSAPPIRNK